jgi:chorismate dehydratase
LIIGDRALAQRKISPYIYDLGLEWKKHTGLPFVFAAWISNKKMDDSFVKEFNEANAYGLDNIESVVRENPYKIFDLHHYYNDCISFNLDGEKNKGLDLFLEKIKRNKIMFA